MRHCSSPISLLFDVSTKKPSVHQPIPRPGCPAGTGLESRVTTADWPDQANPAAPSVSPTPCHAAGTEPKRGSHRRRTHGAERLPSAGGRMLNSNVRSDSCQHFEPRLEETGDEPGALPCGLRSRDTKVARGVIIPLLRAVHVHHSLSRLDTPRLYTRKVFSEIYMDGVRGYPGARLV